LRIQNPCTWSSPRRYPTWPTLDRLAQGTPGIRFSIEGGDLLIRQLGLRVEDPSGCAQFIRGKDLFHSITKWTGRRFVVVNVTHQAVRVSSENKMKAILGTTLSSEEGRKRAREDSGDNDGGGEKEKNPKKSK
jgi:hypothetical protein